MFCPKCRAEYREGFWICADCNIDLVHALPADPLTEIEPSQTSVEWVEVLTTSGEAEISLLKSILESEKIQYFFKGEHYNTLQPGISPSVLTVHAKDAAKVKQLTEDLKQCLESSKLEYDFISNNSENLEGLSVCGCRCDLCEYFKNEECRGCSEIEGTVWWAQHVSATVCPIYDCVVNEKQWMHCGMCSEIPCKLWYDLKDPKHTDLQHAESIRTRLNHLKQVGTFMIKGKGDAGINS